MNKDSKAVKKEKGLFESVIAPIIVGIMFIFLILYKIAEFLGKWLIILSIPSLYCYYVYFFIPERIWRCIGLWNRLNTNAIAVFCVC